MGTVPVISSGGVSSCHDTAIDKGPGVIIGRKGSLGTVHWSPGPYWPHDTTLWVKDFKGNDRRFIYYFLKTLDTKSLDVGSSNPTLNRNHVHPLPVSWPTFSEQYQIAAVLGALDDKIELNRKTTTTLEEMARTLYRSWFVDFDPVHARAESRAPAHMDAATADLFPDSFGEGGLPLGWERRGLDQIADFLNGAALQKFPALGDEPSLPVIKIAELRNGITEASGKASNTLPSKYKITDGDILFSWSGSLLQKVWVDGPGALNQHLFKVSSSVVPRWFHFFAVDFHMDDFRMIAASKATTMGHIQRHHLAEAKIYMPNHDVLDATDRLVRPIFDLAIRKQLETRILATLRDTLIPRLMSGDLRVDAARKMVEAAV